MAKDKFSGKSLVREVTFFEKYEPDGTRHVEEIRSVCRSDSGQIIPFQEAANYVRNLWVAAQTARGKSEYPTFSDLILGFERWWERPPEIQLQPDSQSNLALPLIQSKS